MVNIPAIYLSALIASSMPSSICICRSITCSFGEREGGGGGGGGDRPAGLYNYMYVMYIHTYHMYLV